VIYLCNSIGTPLDSKYIDLAPSYVAMTTSHVVVASTEAFYMWQFKNVKQRAIMDVSTRMKAGMEKLVMAVSLSMWAPVNQSISLIATLRPESRMANDMQLK